jgi:hypothetical protein
MPGLQLSPTRRTHPDDLEIYIDNNLVLDQDEEQVWAEADMQAQLPILVSSSVC